MSKKPKTMAACVELTVEELQKKTKNKDILKGVEDLAPHCLVYVDPKFLDKKAKSD